MTGARWLPVALLAVAATLAAPVAIAGPVGAEGAPAATTVAPWRDTIRAWADEHAQHTAWGVEHAERNYRLALRLAAEEGLEVDPDVLFAAAFLHDIGAIDTFRQEGVDHARRSADLLAGLLLPSGFPPDKLAKVEATVLGHMFSADPGDLAEARVFRDADTLDFLGMVGAARILSLTTRHPWAPSIEGAMVTLAGFAAELPGTLDTPAARRIGDRRAAELTRFLDALAEELDADGVPRPR